VQGESLYFIAYNGSKRGITVNLRSPDGLAVLQGLLAKADVVVENFRAGTMERMGLGYERLAVENPGLIMVSISGFGSDGPYADRPAFDEIIQGMSGLTSLTGEADGPPRLTGTYVSDFLAGVYAALGASLALQLREKTGRGQWVQMNLLQCLVSILNTTVSRYLLLGETPQRQGNRNPLIAPGNIYRVKDGYVVMELLTQDMWEECARAIGRAELIQDPRFIDVVTRKAHAEELDREVQAWMHERTTEEIVATLVPHGLPCGPVLDIPSLVQDPQFRANRTVVEVEYPGVGAVPVLAPPLKFGADSAARRGPAPCLGQHTEAVLSDWLGLGSEEIDRLRRAGAL